MTSDPFASDTRTLEELARELERPDFSDRGDMLRWFVRYFDLNNRYWVAQPDAIDAWMKGHGDLPNMPGLDSSVILAQFEVRGLVPSIHAGKGKLPWRKQAEYLIGQGLWSVQNNTITTMPQIWFTLIKELLETPESPS